jgi:hypothetical protein
MQNDDKPVNDEQSKHLAALDLGFIVIIGLVMLAAFISALTYDFISARTPIVILVPLLILIGLQLKRSFKGAAGTDIPKYIAELGKGKNSEFNGIAGFFGWMILLLVLIFVAGHYAGIAAFMFMLLYLVAGEKLVLSLSVSGGVTLMVFALFEHIFGIELYRGMIYRIWAGYGIF